MTRVWHLRSPPLASRLARQHNAPAHFPSSDDCGVQVYEVVVGKAPERSDAQRRSHPQNPQKGIKCLKCNQVFKTAEHRDQHYRDKHEKEELQSIIRSNREQVSLSAKAVEDTKRQKLAEDRELLDQQRNEKFRLYDKGDRETEEVMAVRELANAEKQEKMTLQEQQSRANYDRAAEELQARQARHVTLASMEFEIQEELRDMMRLLQSVPLEVCSLAAQFPSSLCGTNRNRFRPLNLIASLFHLC
jgi:hypothetical protein